MKYDLLLRFIALPDENILSYFIAGCNLKFGIKKFVTVHMLLSRNIQMKISLSKAIWYEFCILAKNISEQKLREKLECLVENMHAVYTEDYVSARVSISVGAVFCENGEKNIISLLNMADKALYQTKTAGRDGYYIEHI